MAKKNNQKPKTDKIHLKLVAVKVLKTMYKLLFQVVIDGKDGKAKADTPFSVLYTGKEIFTGRSDANGLATFEYKFKYLPTLESVDLICKITGSTAECFETFQLPAPSEVKFTSSSVSQDKNGFTASFTVSVTDKQRKPRPNCKVVFLGNGQEQSAYTDMNGNVSFSDNTILRNQITDKLVYSVSVAHLADSAEITVPAWKHAENKFLKKFNAFPNWKHNRRKALGSIGKTLVIFSSILVLSLIAGNVGMTLASFLLGSFIYWRSEDKDGQRHLLLPTIVTIICLCLLSSLPFVSIMIILSLPVYFWEELSRPIDPETREGKAHPMNPYPKWPIIFGLFMATLCLLGKIPDFDNSGDIIEQLNSAQESGIIQSLKQSVSFHSIINSSFQLIWNSISSLKNWLAFCLILAIYASPEEMMNFFQKSGGGTGAVGLGSIFYALKDLAEPLISFFLRKKRRK